MTETNSTTCYILDANYVFDNKFKLCFLLTNQKDGDNPNETTYYKNLRDDSLYKENFVGKASGYPY